jgi:hypothetical protein
MKEEKKETKTYRYEIEVIKHAEENPMIPSFAEWACDRYRKEFMEVETLAKKMETYFQMGNACKDRLQILKQEIESGDDLNIPKHEREWLRTEAPKRIQKATFEGVYKCYVNTYKRHEINRKQFRLIIERLTGEKLDLK